MNKYEEIIKVNSGLIYMIMNKYFQGYDKDDLYQVGVIGVIKAYNNYKNDHNTKFSTYAFKYIYGEMYNYINNINLQFGMDVTKLYSDECDEGFLGYINYLVKTFAMNLYKVGLFFDRIIKSRH